MEERVAIHVTDTGIGIDEDHCKRIFEPFEQLSDDIRREYGGTGLGLAICDRLARAMGGGLSVSRPAEGGSRFTLSWPTQIVERHPEPGPAEPDSLCVWAQDFPPLSLQRLQQVFSDRGWRVSEQEGQPMRYGSLRGPSEGLRLPVTQRNVKAWLGQVPEPGVAVPTPKLEMKVLVVDDNLINRLVTRNLLIGIGCQVEVVENGQQALDVLHSGHDYQLVLMDLHMPVMDGITATQKIRARGDNVLIVALTADVYPEARLEATRAGVNDLLHKPIRAHDLSRLVTETLRSEGN